VRLECRAGKTSLSVGFFIDKIRVCLFPLQKNRYITMCHIYIICYEIVIMFIILCSDSLCKHFLLKQQIKWMFFLIYWYIFLCEYFFPFFSFFNISQVSIFKHQQHMMWISCRKCSDSTWLAVTCFWFLFPHKSTFFHSFSNAHNSWQSILCSQFLMEQEICPCQNNLLLSNILKLINATWCNINGII